MKKKNQKKKKKVLIRGKKGGGGGEKRKTYCLRRSGDRKGASRLEKKVLKAAHKHGKRGRVAANRREKTPKKNPRERVEGLGQRTAIGGTGSSESKKERILV